MGHVIPAVGSTAVRFMILGPLEVRGAAGESIALQAPKLRSLLTVLLLRPNQRVSGNRLAMALWGDAPPPSAPGVLRTYVTGLRKSLQLGGTDQLPRLATEPGGYRLAIGPSHLDMAVFDDLLTQGQRALAAGNAAHAARLLSSALALWRGMPGEDVALDYDSTAILIGLAERRLTAEETWADAELALGDYANLIGRLRVLMAEQPLRERLCGQLMQALYRVGRKADALSEFRALRHRMIDELGIEPSAPLRKLQHEILAEELTSAPAAPKVVPRQLPSDIGDFTGRGVQLRRVAGLLPEGADLRPSVVVVITGMAGVGKTSLAVHFAHQVADRFPDGQLCLDLHGYADIEPMLTVEALRRLLRALGAHDVPSDMDEAAAMYRTLLAGKRMLILLDNAETASQIRPLLPGTPGCLVLVTSRSRLPGLLARNSAIPVIIGPLTESEGMDLLRKILGGARLAAEPAAAAAIVAHNAGLPLALRIAAEHATYQPRLTLAGLAEELAAEQHRLDVLTFGADCDTTVRSVFAWSYRALAPETARAFRLLGLHPGPEASIPAAAALIGCTADDAARALHLLAGAHLLEEAAPGRFRFHNLLHAYAIERAAVDETPRKHAAAVRRVLLWYLYTADAADRMLAPAHRHVQVDPPPGGPGFPLVFADYAQALAWYDEEHGNLVAAVQVAVEAGADDIAWKLAAALVLFFQVRKPWTDWITCCQIGAEAARRARDAHGEAWMLSALASAYHSPRRFGDALDCLERSLRLWREIGDRRAEGVTLINIGAIHGDLGRYDHAVDCLQFARAIVSSAGDKLNESVALCNLGQAYLKLRRLDEALDFGHQALTLARETGHHQVEGVALKNLADSYRMLRRPINACRCYQQALDVYQRIGDQHGAAEIHCKLGDLLCEAGLKADAREHWRQALAIFDHLNDPRSAEVRRLLETAASSHAE
jgi:DNA-binding SARP family transcriptional activator/tetratricopeptide (TPR) repeat protein